MRKNYVAPPPIRQAFNIVLLGTCLAFYADSAISDSKSTPENEKTNSSAKIGANYKF